MKIMRNKMYEKWQAKNGSTHEVKDMSIQYIRNCIAMIVRSMNPDENGGNKDVFKQEWIDEHGEKYIKAFIKELKSRR